MFGQNNSPVLLETPNFPLLITVYALNHRSTDKMIVIMNQYWWENINMATQSAYLTCQDFRQGNLFTLLPDILNCLFDHSSSGTWISYNFLLLIGINVLLMVFVFSQ